MKSLKRFSLVAILVVVVTMFSSCFKDDDSQTGIPMRGFMSVKEGLFGQKVMVPDGMNVYLSFSNLTLSDKVERAYVDFLFPEDTKMVEGQQYTVTYLNGISLPVKDILAKPQEGTSADTLRNDSILEFDQMWAYGGYVNTHAVYKASDEKASYANMVKDYVSNDTLYLNLNYNLTKGTYRYGQMSNGNYTTETYISFRMPDSRELRNDNIETVNDSIVVAVSAKVNQSAANKLVRKYAKYKLN